MTAKLKQIFKSLPVEARIDISGRDGSKGYVRRKSRDSWVLKDNSNHFRACWGNLEEIVSDAVQFVENGKLRPQLNPMW